MLEAAKNSQQSKSGRLKFQGLTFPIVLYHKPETGMMQIFV
jgi:hypothetical protein